MLDAPGRGDFRFLYRESEGEIDRGTWWRASLPLIVAFILVAASWIFIGPRQPRGPVADPALDARVIGDYLYAIVATFAATLLMVMQYFVSAKRFRSRGLPPALAGLAPFAALLAGATHWIAAWLDGGLSPWLVLAIDALALAALAWSIVVLGLLPEPARRR